MRVMGNTRALPSKAVLAGGLVGVLNLRLWEFGQDSSITGRSDFYGKAALTTSQSRFARRFRAIESFGMAIYARASSANLQTGQSERLQLLAVVPGHCGLERDIQRRFKRLRVAGEWFREDAELTAFIEAVKGGTHPSALLSGV